MMYSQGCNILTWSEETSVAEAGAGPDYFRVADAFAAMWLQTGVYFFFSTSVALLLHRDWGLSTRYPYPRSEAAAAD